MNWLRLWGVVLGALGLLADDGLAQDLQPVRTVEGITEYRLDNGLQVLLVPDESKPTTTVNLTFRVGSRHEGYGETGMAHLLEHLLFKGTPTHRNVWAEFTRRGLRANGTTWLDRTNYFASFAASEDNLRWYLSWQADAMVNSLISREDLDSEMTVVRNEMEMGENSPTRILLEKTLASMFQWHNYGKTTIGARTDVENVDVARLRAFYRTYYQPDNATLIVSGRFDPARTLALIRDTFGRIPKPQRELPRLYTLDPVQDGERSVTLRRVGGSPLLLAGYHIPAAAHPDYPAVELLDIVLSDTPTGRLHKRLVEQGLAAQVFGWTFALAEPGVAFWGAQLAPGQELDKAREALLGVLENFAAEPVTAQELQRAKAKWLNHWDQQFADPERVGVALSESIAQGDWRLFFLLRDRVEAATAADLQRVAVQRLLRSNRTLGTYVPTEQPQRAPAPQMVDVEAQLKQFRPRAAAQAVAAFDATPANIDARTQRSRLANGMAVALLPKPTRGQAVRATLVLRFGDEKSLFGQEQVMHAVAAMLDKGTPTMTREQIQDRLDALRTELSFHAGDGSVTARIATRREHVNDAIALVAQLVRESTFPEAVLEEIKRRAVAEIQQQRHEPGAIAQNALARHGNPYPRGDLRHARSFDEIVADVQGLTAQRLREFHRRFLGASHGQFAAVGDFDAAALRQVLDSGFGSWTSATPFARVPRPFVAQPPARLVFLTPDKQNAVMLMRQPVPLADHDPDHPALALANFLLGGGGDSRLWTRVREREGLSYDVRSVVSWNPFERHSSWVASAIYAPSNRDKVEQAVREEIARALGEGFSAQEVEAGKQALLNFRRLARAQEAQLAGQLAADLYLGRTMAFSQRIDDAIAALRPQQVNEALRRYLKPGDVASVLAGDFKQP